jgi:hypothetical protein
MVAVARAASGALLLLFPRRSLRLCGVDRSTRLARGAVRALGARQIAQALLLDERSRVGAAADVLHAASMLGLAAKDPRARTPALVSAAMATGFAAAQRSSSSARRS